MNAKDYQLQLAAMMRDRDELRARVTALEGTVATLRAALERYVPHEDACAWFDDGVCSCGNVERAINHKETR